MLKSFIKSFLEKGNVIRIELDTWHKWYKEPTKLHNEVVAFLVNEGRVVETILISESVTSNKISILLIDGIEYTLSIENVTYLGPTQAVILRKNKLV
jgi:hypothetical protein